MIPRALSSFDQPSHGKERHVNPNWRTGEALTFLGNIWVSTDGKSMLDSREHLEIVCRFVADHDIFSASSCIMQERKVILWWCGSGQFLVKGLGLIAALAVSPGHESRRGPV